MFGSLIDEWVWPLVLTGPAYRSRVDGQRHGFTKPENMNRINLCPIGNLGQKRAGNPVPNRLPGEDSLLTGIRAVGFPVVSCMPSREALKIRPILDPGSNTSTNSTQLLWAEDLRSPIGLRVRRALWVLGGRTFPLVAASSAKRRGEPPRFVGTEQDVKTRPDTQGSRRSTSV